MTAVNKNRNALKPYMNVNSETNSPKLDKKKKNLNYNCNIGSDDNRVDSLENMSTIHQT
jgi:hypothetical protein